ncbi:NUDIX hydrolase [Thermaurantiacus sp.]|uniref:NUDIX hydrolase n=1 Tax=Thermaurantiacus sp. TaxID=2820283 RepID=UPI00298F3C35|nr:NUDIX hydrolase [Thermaurantiacus sp.]
MGERVWAGRFLEVHAVPHGAGGRWEYVKRAGGISAAVILARTDAGEVVLVEQYRPPLGRPCLELPAGLVGDGGAPEEPLESARRELWEETGFVARHWEWVGEFASSPGMLGETFHLFRATGLDRQGPGGGHAGEGITTHLVPAGDVPRFVAEARSRGAMIDVRLLPLLGLWP